MDPVLLALGSAFVGALLTYLVQNFFALTAQDIAIANDFIAALDKVEAAAMDYWLEHGALRGSDELRKAARLKAAVHATASFTTPARRIFASSFNDFSDLDAKLFDEATGGAFESAGRKADPQRAVSVTQICHEMRSLLREARRSQYWAR